MKHPGHQSEAGTEHDLGVAKHPVQTTDTGAVEAIKVALGFSGSVNIGTSDELMKLMVAPVSTSTRTRRSPMLPATINCEGSSKIDAWLSLFSRKIRCW